jgi:hypothetical protein
MSEKKRKAYGEYGEHIPLGRDDGDDLCEPSYFRGHISLQESHDAMIAYGIIPEGDAPPSLVKHLYARNVFNQFLVCEKGRGAFDVTEVWTEQPPKKGENNGTSVA